MRRAVFVAILAFLAPVRGASAHSGGTDAKGGHYNRRTGEYHYHNSGSSLSRSSASESARTSYRTSAPITYRKAAPHVERLAIAEQRSSEELKPRRTKAETPASFLQPEPMAPIPDAALPARIVGRVIAIRGGDSLTIRTENGATRVLLFGIKPTDIGTPHREELVQRLSLLKGVDVEVDVKGRMSDGSIAGDVFHEGRSINLYLISQGLAAFLREHGDAPAFEEAQAQAKTTKRGIWE